MEIGPTGRVSALPAPSFGDRLAGLARACHPFPTSMVVLLTALVGIASADGEPPGKRLLVTVAAMLLSQLAIGWDNDYVDRGRDAVHQPDKPVPSGVVAPALLAPLIAASFAGAVALGIALGPKPLVFLVLGTGAGFAYNLALKRTRWSWLAYVAGFAVLPPFVWSALGVFRDEFLWLYPVGAPLVVAVHVANALPDIEGDATSGERGLVVRLGKRGSLVLLFACLLLSPALIAVSAAVQAYDAAILGPAVAPYAVLAVIAAATYRSRAFGNAAERAFRLVAAACVILAAGWLAAV